MKRKNFFVPFGIATVALVSLAAGTLLYSRTRPQIVSLPVAPDISVPQPILPEPLPSSAAPRHGGTVALNHLFIFKVVSDDNGSHLERVSFPGSRDGASESQLAVAALDAMADEPNSPLPPGTRVNSYVVDDPPGIPTVDFNKAFVDNFRGGDEAEALAINAILATVGQFREGSVQITVEGKKIDSLGGTVSLTNPILMPQASEQTASSGGKP